MKNKNILAPLLCLLLAAALPAQSFKKGYKHYLRHDYEKASAVFGRYESHPKFAAAAAFFQARIQLYERRDLPALLAADRRLETADSLFRRLSPRRARRQTRRYGVDTAAIFDLRVQAQRWAVAGTRVRGTLPALDSLLETLLHPLEPVQPELEAARRDIVNAALATTDYDTMTALLRRHIGYILPENYGQTRRMNEQIWPAFLEKYSPCALDRFAREHRLTFVGRDCWRSEIQPLLCAGQLPELLDYHARNRWTALETVLLNRIVDLAADSAALSPAQRRHLAGLRLRNDLRSRLRNGTAVRDTAATLAGVLTYVEGYAPRYSAFRLLEESLQFFLERRLYASAVQMLERARPFFPDTLPAGCSTDFDHQRRAQPWIDGKLPILRRPESEVRRRPLSALNTAEGDESNPVVTADGREIFFAASGRAGNLAGQDIFTARRDETSGDWPAPVLVPELSGPADQVPLSCTADGRRMLLLVRNRLCISMRTQRGAPWSDPAFLAVEGIPVLGRGCLSAGGDTLLLEGAYSTGNPVQAPDLDLFVSVRDPRSGAWSRPAALGADVNTDGDETRPLLGADGRTLWYVSTGYPGLGRGDVFVTRPTRPGWTSWERPQNMGKGVNDTFPHRGFSSVSADGHTFWLSVAGENGRGDLWELTVPADGR